jgi:hypothetical protein
MRHLIKTGIPVFVLALVAAAIAAGCAGTPLKTEGVTSGIRAAEEMGAAEVPQASLYLQLAKEELNQAQKLDAQNEQERAASMLLRAEADAELAVVLSRGDVERQEAEEAMARVRQLRRDNP